MLWKSSHNHCNILIWIIYDLAVLHLKVARLMVMEILLNSRIFLHKIWLYDGMFNDLRNVNEHKISFVIFRLNYNVEGVGEI